MNVDGSRQPPFTVVLLTQWLLGSGPRRRKFNAENASDKLITALTLTLALENQMRERNKPRIGLGVLSGLIGGIVASVVMNQFQALLGRYMSGSDESHGAQSLQEGSSSQNVGDTSSKSHEDDDATEKLANVIAQAGLHRELTKAEKKKAGTAIHYAFGLSVGALYGAVAERQPWVTSGKGTLCGTAVWVGADEALLPMLGLSKGPGEQPLSIHAYALSSHLVYGATLEIIRSSVRRYLQQEH